MLKTTKVLTIVNCVLSFFVCLWIILLMTSVLTLNFGTMFVGIFYIKYGILFQAIIIGFSVACRIKKKVNDYIVTNSVLLCISLLILNALLKI